VPEHGHAPCLSVISSTTSVAYSGLDHYAGQHIRTVKLVRGISIVAEKSHLIVMVAPVGGPL
jgi:hypothetical protein